jgi:glycosyltransferase involved in cell wall biosynthesis
MGQVAIEAMLVGLPVVASDVGGRRDVVQHGSTCLMVPPSDPGALAAALDGLLDNRNCDNVWVRRVASAHQFEVAAVAPRIVKVFEEALLSRSRGELLHAE